MPSAAAGPKNVSASSVTPAAARVAACSRQSSTVPAIAKRHDVAVVQHNLRCLAGPEARHGRFKLRFRDAAAVHQRRFRVRQALSQRPVRRQHIGDRAFSFAEGELPVRMRNARRVLHDGQTIRTAGGVSRVMKTSHRLGDEVRSAHVGHDQAVGGLTTGLDRLRAARRHVDRDAGTRAIVELDSVEPEYRPGKTDLLPAQQSANNGDRLLQRGQRSSGVEPHAFQRRPQPRTKAEPRAPAGQFVERADLHRDLHRVTAERIEHAGADALRPGRDCASGGRRHDAARQRIFRKPDAVDASGFGGARLRDAGLRRHSAMQPDA